MEDQTPVGRLILVPALLTLGVTLLRLAGELMNGSPVLFSRARRPVGARSRAGGPSRCIPPGYKRHAQADARHDLAAPRVCEGSPFGSDRQLRVGHRCARCGKISLEAPTGLREAGSVAWYKSLRRSSPREC